MFDLNKLLRPNILNLKPYSSARDEYEGKVGIFLDANENPFGNGLNRYPDPHQRELKAAMSRLKNVSREQIFLGNGSDEPIDLLIRAFCRPGKDKVLLNPPTYGMYQVSADINDVETVKVPLTNDFQLDVASILKETTPVKIIFVCSPNNPTGNAIDANAIKALLEQFEGIVVVDEAYADFSVSESFVSMVKDYPNLVVLQTFSKAWGLAGIRLGTAYASEAIVDVLDRVKPPYNVNTFSQRVALEALANVDSMRGYVTQILNERARMKEELANFAYVEQVYPSDANFLLIKVAEPLALYNFLVEKNIIIRDRSRMTGLAGCVRISIGTKDQNEILLSAMREFADVINEEQV